MGWLGAAVGNLAAKGGNRGGQNTQSPSTISDMFSQSYNQGQVYNPQQQGGLTGMQKGVNLASQLGNFGDNFGNNARQYGAGKIFNWLNN